MMKLTTIRLLGLGCLGILAAGCDMDQTPVSSTNATAVFGTQAGLQLYANSFVNNLPGLTSITNGDNMSDYLAVRSPSTFLLAGQYTPNSIGSWSWTALRNVNFFLANNVGDAVDPAIRNNYNGLARFYRALFYFAKVKQFGDVPWIDHPIDINDSTALFAGRDKRDVVMQHVLEDLDYAIANITATTDPSHSTITKDVARAWKSRIALFEGTFRKYHANGLAQGLGGSANTWLQAAADASQQIMDGGRFSLNTGGGTDNSYRQLFSSEVAPASETMLVYGEDAALAVLHQANWDYTSATTGVGASFVRQFINTYLMIDGTPFTDIAGHDTLSFMTEVKGRDKRLQQTIRMGDYKRLNAGVLVPAPPAFTQSLTGYMPIKWTVDDAGADVCACNTNDVVINRYAEVLLNYAEAKAELGTITAADWTKTVGALRARAGITGGLSTLPTRVDPYLKSTYFPDISDPVILEIRRERGIELVLEGLRFADLVRWKHGELLSSASMPWQGFYVPGANKAMDLNQDGTSDVFFYTGTEPTSKLPGVLYINVSGGTQQRSLDQSDRGQLTWLKGTTRVWSDKMYLYPISAADLTVNAKLGQNPGW
ncbi:MAG TPA: RagB/SusD family nutrient uptake outer membrane protein [Gemmatimonadaceae bacterium]